MGHATPAGSPVSGGQRSVGCDVESHHVILAGHCGDRASAGAAAAAGGEGGAAAPPPPPAPPAPPAPAPAPPAPPLWQHQQHSLTLQRPLASGCEQLHGITVGSGGAQFGHGHSPALRAQVPFAGFAALQNASISAPVQCAELIVGPCSLTHSRHASPACSTLPQSFGSTSAHLSAGPEQHCDQQQQQHQKHQLQLQHDERAQRSPPGQKMPLHLRVQCSLLAPQNTASGLQAPQPCSW